MVDGCRTMGNGGKKLTMDHGMDGMDDEYKIRILQIPFVKYKILLLNRLFLQL